MSRLKAQATDWFAVAGVAVGIAALWGGAWRVGFALAACGLVLVGVVARLRGWSARSESPSLRPHIQATDSGDWSIEDVSVDSPAPFIEAKRSPRWTLRRIKLEGRTDDR